ncbi:MAG: 16S rRNA (uracil(1498)-N(3))-methyltransferase [Halobacteriovoraceae bacterium]|jgi:16S rRNA (uracil1498-N3)-methyltransferase|nr:16S rRNA (uracil(1498)-N(3))-methyltransferase [Halobacteriovoraceae bacterium]
MNLLILTSEQLISENTYEVHSKDFTHLIKHLKVSVGSSVRCGLLNSSQGFLFVKEIKQDSLILAGTLEEKSPDGLPVKLILALPRPKMLKRILRDVSMLGVKEIYLINTFKVEKSFWYTKILEDKYYERYFLDGISQARDTNMPKLHIRKRFKPFVEDELPLIIKDTKAIVAHPGDCNSFPQGLSGEATLTIGPEGGFTEYEINMLNLAGFETRHCGQRILRMETAVVALLSQHANFLE